MCNSVSVSLYVCVSVSCVCVCVSACTKLAKLESQHKLQKEDAEEDLRQLRHVCIAPPALLLLSALSLSRYAL